jgi:hypothetical protein
VETSLVKLTNKTGFAGALRAEIERRLREPALSPSLPDEPAVSGFFRASCWWLRGCTITSITDALNAPRTNGFGYTNDDRLASAWGLYGSRTWQYDAVGNRTQEARTISSVTQTDTYVFAASTNRFT